LRLGDLLDARSRNDTPACNVGWNRLQSSLYHFTNHGSCYDTPAN